MKTAATIMLLMQLAQTPTLTIGKENVIHFVGAPEPQMVQVQCDTYKPKPKGCVIMRGKTLDDLMEILLQYDMIPKKKSQ